MNFILYHATEQEYKFPCEDGRSWKITVENTCKLPGSTMSSTLHDPLFSRKCQTKLTIITNIINSVLFTLCCLRKPSTISEMGTNLVFGGPLSAIAHLKI